jgi:hypothetical protein
VSHLSIGGSLGMIFEHFWDSFNPKDSSSFIQLHQLNFNVVANHIPKFVTHILGVVRLWLLAFIKPSNDIWPITVGDMFY